MVLRECWSDKTMKQIRGSQPRLNPIMGLIPKPYIKPEIYIFFYHEVSQSDLFVLFHLVLQ